MIKLSVDAWIVPDNTGVLVYEGPVELRILLEALVVMLHEAKNSTMRIEEINSERIIIGNEAMLSFGLPEVGTAPQNHYWFRYVFTRTDNLFNDFDYLVSLICGIGLAFPDMVGVEAQKYIDEHTKHNTPA